ncbi:polyprenyl synthetase family protein [Streptomyces avicenniae]|uniref:polyprenyl synthetase family protein n=1 Tax=Streptomyces avicenniae TaxID=500153 RepID=UPI000ADB02E6|nr:polyprenyl synthetase family protein [Streptomyces avicenniae]
MTAQGTPPAQDAVARLAAHRERFDALFARWFSQVEERFDVPPLTRFPRRALDLLRDQSLRGGKRLRVAVLYEAAGLVTGAHVAGLDEAAVAVELLHTHGLVHDDIIDGSPTRRGAPSVHAAYRAEFPGKERTALGLAVLAGDLAAFLSADAVLTAPLPDAVRLAMGGVLLRAGAETVAGQIADLERDFHPLPDEELLDVVAEFKSARYSVLAPLRLGLLAAGQDPAAHDATLRRYAVAVGVLGQLRDDWLDLFGDASATGKPAGSDLREGRRTYAVRALLAAADPAERAVVEAALGDPGCGPATVARIRGIAARRGVDAALRAAMLRHARAASEEAAGWEGTWRADAVAFFTLLPRAMTPAGPPVD